jgi:hypothetical protein
VHILRTERVNSGWNSGNAGTLEVWGYKLVHGEDSGIMFFDVGTQELPCLFIRVRTVDMATPYPLCIPLLTEMTQRSGLRIVDNENIVVVVQLLRIFLVITEVDIFGLLLQQVIFGPLQGIMQGFSDCEEPLVTTYHLPISMYSQATD